MLGGLRLFTSTCNLQNREYKPYTLTYSSEIETTKTSPLLRPHISVPAISDVPRKPYQL